MRFSTDKIEWTDSMKEFAESVVTKKLDRVISDTTSGEMKLTKLNDDSIKLTLCIDGLRAQAVDCDFYAAAVAVTGKIKSIASRAKAKKDSKRHQQLSIADLGISDIEFESNLSNLISKDKLFELKPISIENAIEEFECTDYPFYVFKNCEDDDNISVVYRRYNNTYGLIRCR